jgi:maleylpyruvate isomerase
MSEPIMQLYNFFRSGTSHRLRIALNLKGVDAQYVAVNLRTEEHLKAEFKTLNPQGLVPALVLEDETVLIQSPAIIEWLEETVPEPALLPKDPLARARVRALAAIVGCDIHPINNRRVLEYLKHEFSADQAAIDAWARNWICAGFKAYEALLAKDASRGEFSFGNAPSLADVYLVPQVESARRFHVDLAEFPLIMAVDAACARMEAFRKAEPSRQMDAA